MSTVAHGHEHGPHGHHHHAEPTAVLGAVPVLDIGDGIGAVVATLGATTASGELFAEPIHEPGAHFHTGVHARHLGDEHVFVAVFVEVAEGTYRLLRDDGSEWLTLEVRSGEVTELDLRE